MSNGEKIYYFDAGNTRLKLWACNEYGAVVAETSLPHGGRMQAALTALPEEFVGSPKALLGASVLSAEQEDAFAKACQAVWQVSPQYARSRREQCGVRNGYGEDYARLGIDRWLALLGCDRTRMADGAVACIADCGTAVTLDLLHADGRHLGGYILPGLEMMPRALLQHTARVRDELPKDDSIAPGRGTGEAIAHGAMLALTAAIEALARSHAAKLILTGGDATRVGSHLRVLYCEDPHLLLKGLKRYFEDAGITIPVKSDCAWE